MTCPMCGNDDQRLMFKKDGEMICRKCITFQSGLEKENSTSFSEKADAEYTLGFELSEKQKELSQKLVEYVEEGSDVLVYAACGGGKTEIVLDLIKVTLNKSLIIGIAVPRRQVVLQLYDRLSQYFTKLKVVAVCEGLTDEVDGDLIICTTHQLFRYRQYFDVLIVDEPDAFPFANNMVLQNIMRQSVTGSLVYLSATPTEEMKTMKTLCLFRRFHNHDLLVPTVFTNFKIILLYKMWNYLKVTDKVMLFVPTIALAKTLSKILKAPCIHSKTPNKEELMKEFESNQHNVLICTTIMERGVTFEGVNICVLYADHSVFSKASLIQIAGRVGRSVKCPRGTGIFLCLKQTRKVNECIQELTMMNA